MKITIKNSTFLAVILCISNAYAVTVGPWNLDSLYAVPKWETTDVAAKEGLVGILYHSIEYKGNPVQVFAYYSAPDGEVPEGGWPATIFVHGGGGTAYTEAVEYWNAQGYAAISMDLEGHYPISDAEGKRLPTPNPGPSRVGVWDDYKLLIEEQWYYHAVAQILKAHSLLASFPEVNASKIGIIGPSWGGTLTSTVMGVDSRLAWAIPVYGAGFLSESDGHQGDAITSQAEADFVNTYYDGSAYFENVTFPTLWLNGLNDFHFSLTCNQLSSQKVNGATTLMFVDGFKHGNLTWRTRDEVYMFANSVVKDGIALPKFEKPYTILDEAFVVAYSDVGVSSAQLYYTNDGDDVDWNDRIWKAVNATVSGNVISADIPDSTTVILFTATDSRGLMVTSEYLTIDQKRERNFENTDTLSLDRSPVAALDSSFFQFVPKADYGDMMQASDSTTFTTDYQPSGSTWGEHCNEEDVYLARLKHTAGTDDSWDLRIGKGGQIYSFIGPYGEGVPPSSKEHSRWNDEVWQPVSVSGEYNNADAFEGIKSMKYFIHGAGNYINEESQTNTFYSPLMASWYNDDEKAYYVNNWGQQAHVPSLYKSGLLYTTKYKDIGEGVLEVTYVIQNFGNDVQDHLNVPWGGVRSSSLRGQFLSLPDQSIIVNTKTTGSTGSGNYDIDETGGFFIFANDTVTATSPSMGIVFGNEIRKDELSDHNLSNIFFRHAQVGGDTNPRDYSLFVVIPKLEVRPGETFYYRVYFVNGTKTFVHEKSKELVPFVEYGFINSAMEETPTVTIKTSEIDSAFTQDITLFASPVKDNVPLFLMENTETGVQYISPDLYYNVSTEPFINPYSPEDEKYETYQNRDVNRPYDGKIKYIKLVGYGVQKKFANSSEISFGLLDTFIVNGDKIILTDEYKNQILVPISYCKNCNEGTVEEEDDGLTLYNNFSDEDLAEVKGTVAVTFTQNVANPDLTAGHSDYFVGKVVRGEATHANIRFDLPEDIDLSIENTITLKAYFESAESVLPDNCKITVILRNSATGGSNQFLKTVNIPEANKWSTLSFDLSGASARGTYDQVWLFFSMSDASGATSGQVFYIDELRGPAFYIDSYRASTSATYDSVLIDLSANAVDLKELTNPVFKLERTNKGDEISISEISFEGQKVYLKLAPDANISYRDDLVLSFTSGEIVDIKGKELPYFTKLNVKTGNTLKIKVIDAKTKGVIPHASLLINDTTVSADQQGIFSLKMLPGNFDFTIRKAYYHDFTSSVNITSDFETTIELNVKQANIQVKVSNGTSIIEGAELILNDESKFTDSEGFVLFEGLDLLNEYAFECKAAGYISLEDKLELLNDTLLELTMDVLSGMDELKTSKIKLFPNPSSGVINLQSQLKMKKISVYNSLGQLIRTYQLNDRSFFIRDKSFDSGIYMLEVQMKDGHSYSDIMHVVD